MDRCIRIPKKTYAVMPPWMYNKLIITHLRKKNPKLFKYLVGFATPKAREGSNPMSIGSSRQQ